MVEPKKTVSRNSRSSRQSSKTWPECLRDANGFYDKVERLTYDPGCCRYGPATFYARWLTNFDLFLGLWSPLVGLYALIMGSMLIALKYFVLNPPLLGRLQTRRRYDFQLPMSFCMSTSTLPHDDDKSRSKKKRAANKQAQKAVARDAGSAEFWRWFTSYFLNITSAVPTNVRTQKFSIFTMTPGEGSQLWYEQVNVPIAHSLGVHFPLSPVSGEVHVRPAEETCSLTIRFCRWHTHWGLGSVVATPHPDPDIPFSIWFRASFQVWPFLGWLYDIIVSQCIKYYIDECLRICSETDTLEGEYEVKFSMLEQNRMISRIIRKGTDIADTKPVWR